MDWDITRYADRLPRKAVNRATKAAQASEDSLKTRYPPQTNSAAELPKSRPCIIVDMQGIILAWYLPGILRDSRQVSLFTSSDRRIFIKYNVCQSEMMAATANLHPLLGKRQSGASWRSDPGNFPSGAKGVHGSVNISPAWFQQGHEVSCASL